jgi:hypothetical protein
MALAMLRLVRCQVLPGLGAVSVLGAPLWLVKASPSEKILDLGSAAWPLVPSSCMWREQGKGAW